MSPTYATNVLADDAVKGALRTAAKLQRQFETLYDLQERAGCLNRVLLRRLDDLMITLAVHPVLGTARKPQP